MKTLIVDTSHRYLAVGVAVDGVLVASKKEELNKQQSEYVLPFVQDVLRQAGLTLQDLNQIAVTDGPGSYTGMRIGITFVKTVAMVLENLEVYKVNTLLSLSGKEDVFAFIDARSGRTFGAYCKAGTIVDERVYMVEEIADIEVPLVGDTQLLGQEPQNISVLENILQVKDSWEKVENVDILVPRYLK